MAKEVPEIERRQNGDDALVMRARSDCNAFILLYDIYYEKVLRFCFTHLRIRQITEDITSIVFIKAAQNILKFKGKTRRQFVQWLYDIASAEIKHYLKKNVSDRRGETQIEIDDTHKERLRIKLQIAYEQGQAKKSKMPLYLPIAAAMILVGIFIMLSPSHQKPVASPEKPKPLPKFESQKPAKIIERKPAEQPKSASDETIAAAEEEEIEAEEASYEEAEIALVQEPNEAKNAQEQLFEGIVVKGRVLDWQNNPLPATVIKGPFPNEQQTKTLCDANGNFEFHSAQEGIEVITVQCQGAAPAVLPIEIKSGMEPITIMLSPPNIISGQVIDDNGFPIEGAKISAAAWRGVGSLVFSAQTNSQ